MFPHEARLRNLTYNSPLYCDISCKTYEADGGVGAAEAEEERENPKEFLGWVPIMLRSSFCVLVSDVLLLLLVLCLVTLFNYLLLGEVLLLLHVFRTNCRTVHETGRKI